MIVVLARNNFTKLSITLVRKLTNKKIQLLIRQLERGKYTEDIARFMRVTRRRIYQLKQRYGNAKRIPELKEPGREKRPLNPEFEQVILDTYQIYKSGPVIFEKIIKTHNGLTIPHNTIYQVMLMHQLVIGNPKKKGQRK